MIIHKIICVTAFIAMIRSTELYSSTSDIVDLISSNFNELVIQSDSVWVVEFYSPSNVDCQALVPVYSGVASILKGIVKVGGINSNRDYSLGKHYGIKSYPTIKIFGYDKQEPEDYAGQNTVNSFIDTAFTAMKIQVISRVRRNYTGQPPSDVVELTDSNFDSLVLDSNNLWLIDFYAPWCAFCKSLAPHWKKAATQLKGKVKLGALDATVHTNKAHKYEIEEYPTLKVFTKDKNFNSTSVYYEYNGGRTTTEIVQWALDKLSGKNQVLKITQLINKDQMAVHCLDRLLCVISVLPHILDCPANCRQVYLDILLRLEQKFESMQWGWLWFEAKAQPDVERIFSIGAFGYPSLAVVNSKKMRFVTLRGLFSFNGIHELLQEASFGQLSTPTIRINVLPVIRSTEPWDGTDSHGHEHNHIVNNDDHDHAHHDNDELSDEL